MLTELFELKLIQLLSDIALQTNLTILFQFKIFETLHLYMPRYRQSLFVCSN